MKKMNLSTFPLFLTWLYSFPRDSITNYNTCDVLKQQKFTLPQFRKLEL